MGYAERKLKVALAFARGAPSLELVAWAATISKYRFYLLDGTMPCASTATGCTRTDLYTETVEKNWVLAMSQRIGKSPKRARTV